MEDWVRKSLWMTVPLNLIAAFAISFPASGVGRVLELPEQQANFYSLFAGGLVGLFGFMYLSNATPSQINKPILSVGAVGKAFAVLLSAILYFNDMFSGVALAVVSGDILFASFWLYWLLGNRSASAA